MTAAALETLIARSLPVVEEKEWVPNREITLARMRELDELYAGYPTCRLCGQVVIRLDTFGLCSKVSEAHQQYRGFPTKKARKR